MERTLTITVKEWVLKTACRQAREEVSAVIDRVRRNVAPMRCTADVEKGLVDPPRRVATVAVEQEKRTVAKNNRTYVEIALVTSVSKHGDHFWCAPRTVRLRRPGEIGGVARFIRIAWCLRVARIARLCCGAVRATAARGEVARRRARVLENHDVLATITAHDGWVVRKHGDDFVAVVVVPVSFARSCVDNA